MKFIFTLILLTLGLLSQAQIPSYVPTNGLVGWWPFNGNANDESGNGNHGTVNGATLAADRFGNVSKAYSLNGIPNRIEIGNSLNLGDSLGAPNTSWSISAWVNKNNYRSVIIFSDYNSIQGNTNPGENDIILSSHFQIDDTTVYFSMRSYPYDFSVHGGRILSNNWYHVTITIGNGNMNLYVDGSAISSNSYNPSLNFFENPVYRFGTSVWNGIFNKGTGLLDDIAIYNRALSAAEVQQLYSVVCAKPTFTTQPQNKSVAQGQTTTFAVQVDSASRYQWQMNLGLGAGWTNIPSSTLFSGDTTATLTVEGRNPLDGARFRCIATSCKADTSNAATLTVTSSATAAAGAVAGVPGLINYQGSALDSAGKPMKNQTISLKLSVVDSSSSGAAVYVESHTAATNGSGHFSIQIGGGTAMLGKFDSVGWANGRNKYLKTELSQNGTWVNLGTSQLVSVPYALHAGSASYSSQAGTIRDSAGNVFSVGYSNGQPTLVAAPGSGSASNPGSFACGQSINYAGESYPTVQIGTQCWFQKNVNAGSMIQGANDQTNNSVLEKYCYNNDTANCAIYGGLYQWAEAVQYQNGASNTTSPSPAFSGNVKGICPTGWHVPNGFDFGLLTLFCGGENFAGDVLKSKSNHWNIYNNMYKYSYNSNFLAFPSGYRRDDGYFFCIGTNVWFWNSDEFSTESKCRSIKYDGVNFSDDQNAKNFGFSVRCLKD